MSQTKRIVLSGVFIALGILIPVFFHMVELGGQIFLPMHIPVILSGFVVGPTFGLLVGMVTPLISSVLTGMPPLFPMAVIMMFELGTYGFLSGIVYEKAQKNAIIALVGAMLGGRIIAGCTAALLVYLFGVKAPFLQNPAMFVWGSIITGLPGIVIQIVLIPTVVVLLNKSNILSEAKDVTS